MLILFYWLKKSNFLYYSYFNFILEDPKCQSPSSKRTRMKALDLWTKVETRILLRTLLQSTIIWRPLSPLLRENSRVNKTLRPLNRTSRTQSLIRLKNGSLKKTSDSEILKISSGELKTIKDNLLFRRLQVKKKSQPWRAWDSEKGDLNGDFL